MACIGLHSLSLERLDLSSKSIDVEGATSAASGLNRILLTFFIANGCLNAVQSCRRRSLEPRNDVFESRPLTEVAVPHLRDQTR